jgi:hypothetical protein
MGCYGAFMNAWAKKTAERVVSVERETADAIERSDEERTLLLHRVPRCWQELREWLKSACQELNKEAGRRILEFEVWPVSGVRIRSVDRPALLQLEFDEEALRVRYSCGAGKGEYRFGANLDRTVVFEDAYHRQFTVESVGERLLDLLRVSQF